MTTEDFHAAINAAVNDLVLIELDSDRKAAIARAKTQMIGGLLYLEMAIGKERAAQIACAIIEAAGIMTMVWERREPVR